MTYPKYDLMIMIHALEARVLALEKKSSKK